MDAAQRHMDVGMPRVVVVDRHPFKLCPELLLERVHEPSGVLSQVEGMGVLRGDDELEEPLVSGLLPGAELICDPDPAVLVPVEARPSLALSLGSLLGEIATVSSPPAAAAIREVTHLDGAALQASRRRVGLEHEGPSARSRSRHAAKTCPHPGQPTCARTAAALHRAARP
ncbi:MAG TPA: hypothetical protein VKM54_28275 [Myxococcota bacterium]|nr:hypothetical protein [Myxococcota bacterium]